MTTRPDHWRKALIEPNPRATTNKILRMVDEGLIDKDTLIVACLKWMSEDDVREMAKANELILEDEEDEED